MFFRAIFLCRNPQSGIIKLECGWRQSSERKQRWEVVSCWLSRQRCCVADMEAHEWSCLSGRFVDGFQDLPWQFGRVWSSKILYRFKILVVVLGGSTLIKNLWNKKTSTFYPHVMAELPKIVFGRKQGNVTYRRLGLIKWLQNRQRKTSSQIPRSHLEVRYKYILFIF